MNKINIINTSIEGLVIIEPTVFGDSRGYFMETYNERDFYEKGITEKFVQDNQSMSSRGVLRGLHFQKNNPQGKLVRVLFGEVLDVAVDLRENSLTYGKWESVILSGENNRQLYVPKGFAHGCLVKREKAVFSYKCTDFYDPSDEGGIMWNDPDLAIDWQTDEKEKIILSEKDKYYPSLRESCIKFRI
ncbi:MAG: dTDP-4-dehydrorhamnose 3,5-epimerase [Ruminiclostridium sp.]|nr:dTDP-4-dehydrorhamnose 3,5-epimerase [Ruminiclostridium sp.]